MHKQLLLSFIAFLIFCPTLLELKLGKCVFYVKLIDAH